jgi:DNA-binding MarR family transcriptional regulator
MQPADPFAATLQEWVAIFMRRSMKNFLTFTRESGLSMSQFGAMFHIHREGGCGVTDLGDNLGVTSAAASQMLERLVQQGLITRSEDPVDRRVKQLVITEKGAHLIKDSTQARLEWLHDFSATLTDSEKEQVSAALHILIEKAKMLESSAAPQN